MSEEVILLKSSQKLCPTIFRLATLFGWSYRMRFDLAVNIIAAKAMKENMVHIYGGDQWRPFLHVQDAARAFANAIEVPKEKINREIINLGGNALNHRIEVLGEIVRQIFPDVIIERKQDIPDKRDYRVSFDKVASILSFQTERSIFDGMKEIAQNLKNSSINYQDDIYYNVKYLFR